ncbi:hypothetical protein [Frateuria sp. STR12]|uniref:hypothetical protein n=1 Tax=Frateuria hangzhouensis TaxID=2995589 RepID=UPI002260FF6C|nr:hypothetical protein [Frateuria sp. STR12]MCX7514461.1 hypothetical protein [Frateuria sp. STR12]
MRKILFAAIAAAGVFAAPTFAQVDPGATAASARAGASASGTTTPTAAGVGAGTSATATSGTQPMGLGDLLKQQSRAHDTSPAIDSSTDGAGPTGSLEAKARAKAHAHGH